MAGLSGNSVGQTYKDLLTILGSTAGEGLEATEKQVFDGDGVGAAMKLSTNSVNLTGAFKLGNTEVTATATELNLLDGATLTTEEMNLLTGVTNLGDNVTVPNIFNTSALVSSGHLLKIQNNSVDAWQMRFDGVMVLKDQGEGGTPTAVEGGIYFDGTNIHLGV